MSEQMSWDKIAATSCNFALMSGPSKEGVRHLVDAIRELVKVVYALEYRMGVQALPAIFPDAEEREKPRKVKYRVMLILNPDGTAELVEPGRAFTSDMFSEWRAVEWEVDRCLVDSPIKD